VERHLFTADHDACRETVREFVSREVMPPLKRWDSDRLIDRNVWHAAGKQGIIGLSVPQEYGGGGQPDHRYRVVVSEELSRAGAASLHASFSLQDDIIIPYINDLGAEEQKRRWLTGMATGELIGAIAMTEPAAGSDLQGVRTTGIRDGDEW
jgi:alkylation response protein AidB-like acyl-CoA dehydrogenase